ncbi:MAG: hypothetical protein K9W46_04590 [Candidatus Heimdallarchaeum endolithica]|uniref:Uncharacterized protein n=1 Tax=Candidatus Heimdallarchaeum endolithica TaxID=2876572 RepID=A0A9Y1BT28_9ARCH|nr:MAG: hypothetical protein K9W46_04590 [Candidatus Heimdallarchaeum endolithica]
MSIQVNKYNIEKEKTSEFQDNDISLLIDNNASSTEEVISEKGLIELLKAQNKYLSEKLYQLSEQYSQLSEKYQLLVNESSKRINELKTEIEKLSNKINEIIEARTHEFHLPLSLFEDDEETD